MQLRADIPTKLAAARARLLLERPFVGALVMHLPLTAARASWCATTATDARAFYYNPEFIAGLSLAETQFMLAHDALHCALGHFVRRGTREPRRWDVACEHAVNLLLVDEGMVPPPGALRNPAFRGLAAEEIYPLVPEGTLERTLDLHLFGRTAERAKNVQGAGSAPQADDAVLLPSYLGAGDDRWDDAGNEGQACSGPPRPPPVEERERLQEAWQGRLAMAAQQARYAGRLGESWSRSIDGLLQPRLEWRALLARHVMSLTRDDYSYQRPSRRECDALLPRLRGDEIDLYIALDTSGSIGDDEMREFAAEIEALKGQVRTRITLHACDAKLDADGPWYFDAWEPVSLPPHVGGGGGTSFRPVFDWIADRHLRPDLLLYFTDAEGTFPAHPPDFPVLWLVKGAHGVPWGERIQLN